MKDSKEQIEASMKVLNDDFAEMGLKWKHVGTTWILKKDWFEGLEMGGCVRGLLCGGVTD